MTDMGIHTEDKTLIFTLKLLSFSKSLAVYSTFRSDEKASILLTEKTLSSSPFFLLPSLMLTT